MSLPFRRRCWLVTGFLLAAARASWADGGAVLSQQVVGPYRITLFGSPSPLRAGPADLSVMLQDAQTGAPVLDQAVAIQVMKAASSDSSSTAWVPPCCSMKTSTAAVPATHAAAQNKLLYAANFLLPASGRHDISVTIGAPGSASPLSTLPTLHTQLTIAPPAPPLTGYWAYLAAPPLVVVGFALNQRLRRRI